MNCSQVKDSTVLGSYIFNNLNRIHQNVPIALFGQEVQSQQPKGGGYCGLDNNFIITKSLQDSWNFLTDFKFKAGIYQFVLGS